MAGNVISDTARSYTYDTLISQTVNDTTTLFARNLTTPLSQVLAAQASGGASRSSCPTREHLLS